MADLRWPGDTHRHAVLGRTGSGKTQFAFDTLSRRSWPDMPWYIYDFKGERLFQELEGIGAAREVGVMDPISKYPGLYIVRPIPKADDEAVAAHMHAIWVRENCGVYVDEGYMVARNNHAFLSLLTQGRSKNCPMIVLSQRPVFLSKFVWSESDFFSVFNFNNLDDRVTLSKFVPVPREYVNGSYSLPEYFSYYFDVGQNYLTAFKPVPEAETILERFDARKPKRFRSI